MQSVNGGKLSFFNRISLKTPSFLGMHDAMQLTTFKMSGCLHARSQKSDSLTFKPKVNCVTPLQSKVVIHRLDTEGATVPDGEIFENAFTNWVYKQEN